MLRGAVVLPLALVGVLPFALPASAEYDCGDQLDCDAGFTCDLAVHQGFSIASATWSQGSDGDATASSTSEYTSRWVRTTCTTVSLRAYTLLSDAWVTMSSCLKPCAGSVEYDVWVESIRDWEGAFCAVSSGSCDDDEDVQASATKTGIAVSIPNTVVDTQNCAYATTYYDTDDDGQWSDNPVASPPDDCAPTENLVGPLPL